jgi:hypothetical protein
MAESLIAVTQGSGKNVQTFNRTTTAGSVEQEVNVLGEPFLAAYVANLGSAGSSIATANDHVLTLNAGASLNVFVRRIIVYQTVVATTAAIARFEMWSTTTAAPTGGTSTTPFRMDNADAAAGASGMALPTVKGTESRRIWSGSYMVTQTVATAGGSSLMFDINFDQFKHKSFIIPAGTTNGLAFKNIVATAGCSIVVNMYFSEGSYL